MMPGARKRYRLQCFDGCRNVLMRTTIAAATSIAISGCAAPFAEMQGARLAGRGRVELTAAYSNMDAASDGETLKIQDVFALHAATGISRGLDLRARLERIIVSDASSGVDVGATTIGVGPKFSVRPDQLAVFLPIGYAFQGDVSRADTWQFHPTILFTQPVGRVVDVNAAIKALVPISDHRDPDGSRADVLVALNIGLGINLPSDHWVIRPEFGIAKNPGESGALRHFSIGLSHYLRLSR
jgi:hypothetical protein